MTAKLACLLVTSAALAQHIEYPRMSPSFPSAPILRDSSGRFILVQKGLCLSLGPGGNCGGVLQVQRFSPEMEPLTGSFLQISGSELEAVNLGGAEPVVALDGLDRFYIGGTDRAGRPWLRRDDGWQMEATSVEARIVGVVFDYGERPVLLVTGKGRPALWQLDVGLGTVLTRFEFGRAGQTGRGIARAADGAVFAIADATVFRISDLSRVDFEVRLGGQTELSGLAVGTSGLYVVGSTVGTEGIDGVFETTPGTFMPEPPARSMAGNPVAMVARLDPRSGVPLAYLGGSVSERGRDLTVDAANVHVLGSTSSADFPVTGGFRTHCGPDRSELPLPLNEASFVTTLDTDLKEVLSSATFPFNNVRELSTLTNGAFTLRESATGFRNPMGGDVFRYEPGRREPSTVRCIVNAANYEPVRYGAVPGQILTVFGEGLGPQEPLVFDGQTLLPREAAGIEVYFDDVPAPLLAVLDSQINFLVPLERRDFGQGWIEVRREGRTLLRRQFGKGEVDPVPLVRVNASGRLVVEDGAVQADAINEDGSRNSAANPAAPGSFVSVFATGLGLLIDPNPGEDAGGMPPATPRLDFLVDTAAGFIEPQSASTQPRRTKGVIELRFRVPGWLAGPVGFAPVVKTQSGVQIPLPSLPYVLFVR